MIVQRSTAVLALVFLDQDRELEVELSFLSFAPDSQTFLIEEWVAPPAQGYVFVPLLRQVQTVALVGSTHSSQSQQ